MTAKRVEKTLGSAVASSGTFTVDYPANTNAGSFADFGHKAWLEGLQYMAESPVDISLSFGASNITVTWNGSTTIPAGSRVNVELNQLGVGNEFPANVGNIDGVTPASTVLLNLGAPDVADANGVCESQAINTTGSLDGALVSGGEAVFDVPRNVVAAWTTTAVLTVTGEDEYGNTIVESSASGTSMTGKKAFKKVTAVESSTGITGATVGTGDVFGLPVYLPGSGYVLRELEDGAAPTAGTLVAGDDAEATATTGDVRGTYDPNSAADGAKVFALVAALPDPTYKGVSQYGG